MSASGGLWSVCGWSAVTSLARAVRTSRTVLVPVPASSTTALACLSRRLSVAAGPAASALPAIERPAFSLAGKLVLLTGGAQGLGLVMGQAIFASGADLALVDLNKDEAQVQANLMTEAFKKKYPDQRTPVVTAHYANVADETSVDACVSEVVAAHAATVISGLVTSAGFVENIPAEDYPPARLRALWAVNVDGTYLFAAAVARHLKAARAAANAAASAADEHSAGASGQIPETTSMVLIGSMSGAIVNVPQPQTPYNISKAAVRHMAASLAVEWAPAGIRVNCLSPGYMQTALTAAVLDTDPALHRQWIAGVPQGRLGVPSDLAGPVVFLLSDAARYITGAELRVDGGYTLI